MTSKSTVSARIGLAAAALALCVSAAAAADLDAEILDQDGVTPVEYGSGWYLRGDIGWDFSVHGNLSYYSDTRYDYDSQTFGEGMTYSTGFGYIFNDYLRADLTLDYNGNMDWSGNTWGVGCGIGFDGDCFSEDSATFERYTLQINGYLSPGRWGGLSPYVGAGIGLTHIAWDDYSSTAVCAIDPAETCPYGVHSGGTDTEYFDGPTTDYPGSSQTVMSYSLMGGLDYKFDDRWSVDLGYKYTRIHGGIVVAGDANGPGDPQGSSKYDPLGIHELRVGLRYEIW